MSKSPTNGIEVQIPSDLPPRPEPKEPVAGVSSAAQPPSPTLAPYAQTAPGVSPATQNPPESANITIAPNEAAPLFAQIGAAPATEQPSKLVPRPATANQASPPTEPEERSDLPRKVPNTVADISNSQDPSSVGGFFGKLLNFLSHAMAGGTGPGETVPASPGASAGTSQSNLNTAAGMSNLIVDAQHHDPRAFAHHLRELSTNVTAKGDRQAHATNMKAAHVIENMSPEQFAQFLETTKAGGRSLEEMVHGNAQEQLTAITMIATREGARGSAADKRLASGELAANIPEYVKKQGLEAAAQTIAGIAMDKHFDAPNGHADRTGGPTATASKPPVRGGHVAGV